MLKLVIAIVALFNTSLFAMITAEPNPDVQIWWAEMQDKTELEVSCCGLEQDDAYNIAKALEDNNTIKDINISENRIGDKGIHYLAQALRNNNTLSSLDVSNNYISQEGALRLIETLKKNKTLMHCNLDDNKIEKDNLIAIKALLDNRSK